MTVRGSTFFWKDFLVVVGQTLSEVRGCCVTRDQGGGHFFRKKEKEEENIHTHLCAVHRQPTKRGRAVVQDRCDLKEDL